RGACGGLCGSGPRAPSGVRAAGSAAGAEDRPEDGDGDQTGEGDQLRRRDLEARAEDGEDAPLHVAAEELDRAARERVESDVEESDPARERLPTRDEQEQQEEQEVRGRLVELGRMK